MTILVHARGGTRLDDSGGTRPRPRRHADSCRVTRRMRRHARHWSGCGGFGPRARQRRPFQAPEDADIMVSPLRPVERGEAHQRRKFEKKYPARREHERVGSALKARRQTDLHRPRARRSGARRSTGFRQSENHGPPLEPKGSRSKLGSLFWDVTARLRACAPRGAGQAGRRKRVRGIMRQDIRMAENGPAELKRSKSSAGLSLNGKTQGQAMDSAHARARGGKERSALGRLFRPPRS
jgi:hypothetical protein